MIQYISPAVVAHHPGQPALDGLVLLQVAILVGKALVGAAQLVDQAGVLPGQPLVLAD